MSAKLNAEIEECIRSNIRWQYLPFHLRQILKGIPKNYDNYVFNYSLKNQLRYKGNLVRHCFRNEQRYYELLVNRSITGLCLFPYHLADLITKGLRVTPFNYYIDILCHLLKNDRNYDTLPNFTAADCLRVLGIGRNEYLGIISEMKTNATYLFRKPNPINYLPKFPVHINIEPWWKLEIGYVLESDIKYVTDEERSLIDDLIDFGSFDCGKVNYDVVHSLYRKGLIYLDVPINGEDKICIPPLKNFVMNRVSGDYFENLLYKIFVSTDEYTTISELSQMLQLNLDIVKDAISLFCRLGFAQRKPIQTDDDCFKEHSVMMIHESWNNRIITDLIKAEITPLNYHSLLMNETNDGLIGCYLPNDQLQSPVQTPSSPKNFNNTNNNNNININQNKKMHNLDVLSNSMEYISSDGNISDYSIINSVSGGTEDTSSISKEKSCSSSPNESSEIEETSAITITTTTATTTTPLIGANNRNGLFIGKTTPTGVGDYKRIAFLFDSTLTAFLMMGNLSPGLKNHAVTMFEVGKLSDESMDTFLAELEKVSLLDAEGEGEVSRYFAHAVILRSTIIALRNNLNIGLDLLRLECLESLDVRTRDRLLERKYKFIISVSPLTSILSNIFTIPFFGQFYKSSTNSHLWTKIFYYHISGYGPPSLLLTKGTILRDLPRLFLGYGKLLVTIVQSDSYVINSENYISLNDQLRNNCILVQAYGIRNPAEVHYESFPFDQLDSIKSKWSKHKAIERLQEHLNLQNTCGYITFIKTGVPDIGCENYDIDVHLKMPTRKNRKNSSFSDQIQKIQNSPSIVSTTVTTSTSANSIPVVTVQPKIQQKILTPDLNSPMDGSEITSFNRKTIVTTVPTTPTTTTATTNIETNSIIQKLDDCLKSPDENYFAETPKSNASPSNVFRSIDCNEILATELAKLDDNNSSDDDKRRNTLVSQSSIEISIDGNSTGQTEQYVYQQKSCGEDWTLLDVNFGMPLFDVDCNTRICENLVKYLTTDENLQNMHKVNASMNKTFLKFISQCLYFEDDDMRIVNIGKLIPQPQINLVFDCGKISYWNGK